MSDDRSLRDARVSALLKKRYARERRFKAFGLAAILFSALVLAFLLVTMTANGVGGFKRTELQLVLDLPQSGMQIDAERLRQPDSMQGLELAGLPRVIEAGATAQYGPAGDDLLSTDAWRETAARLAADPSLLARKVTLSLPASDDLASALR